MADNWVGGDLSGMQSMGTTMKAAPSEMKGVVTALSSKVDSLVGDAGWKGDAAADFRKGWTANSVQSGALSDVVGQVGGIMDGLAAKLQDIDNALYNAAHAAQQKGVKIGPKGEPQPVATTAGTTDPQAAATAQAASEYADAYNTATQLAKGHRLNAAGQLSGIYDQISFDPGKQNSPDQWVTVGDFLRGLYTIPGEKNIQLKGKLGSQIADAQNKMRAARKDLKPPVLNTRKKDSNYRRTVTPSCHIPPRAKSSKAWKGN